MIASVRRPVRVRSRVDRYRGARVDADVVVVGGGIVGLATAHRLLEARPGLTVQVLERNDRVGADQSSRNSGVLHAGLYYTPGSAKARWCRAGKAAFERFAATHDVPVTRTGKVVAAVERREIPLLRALVDRARANGVTIEELDADGVREHEPNLTALAGAYTPETAVTDFRVACERLSSVVEAAGGTVRTGVTVTAIDEGDHAVRVTTDQGELAAQVLVGCAGLASDRLARMAGLDVSERIVPFRGAWLELDASRAHLVRGSIYPVPRPGLPFLGVHLTRRIDGTVWLGPNAVLAGARHGRRPFSLDRRDLFEMAGFPGVWRLAARQLGTGVGELARDRLVDLHLREVRRYVPDIIRADVRRGPWGVRAQLVRRDGTLVDDFVVRDSPRGVHVLNAPSPAATASLAIGQEVARRAIERLTD
jgi:(S)-2-hydroxyglutarate dehydrogenase